jgi:hypothetical protein
MDFEIKKSLRVDHTDVDFCCLIMRDLIKLPFNRSHLFIAPVIVDTIKKVYFATIIFKLIYERNNFHSKKKIVSKI